MNILLIITAMLLISFSMPGQTGSRVQAVKLVNVENTDTNIPFLGAKVVVVFYVDPDVQKFNDPFSDALEEEKFPLDKFAVIGIVDCKDTWLPNAIIRMKAKKEQEHFPQSLILLDYDHSLSRAWNLGNCNNKIAVMIIGRGSNVRYLKVVSSVNESRESVPAFLETIKNELKLMAASEN